jgi:hypothetical protein
LTSAPITYVVQLTVGKRRALHVENVMRANAKAVGIRVCPAPLCIEDGAAYGALRGRWVDEPLVAEQ